jgi:hypothetical protein
MLIFLGVGDRIEPWEPRAHPVDWLYTLRPRERRWRARRGSRGRRSAQPVRKWAWYRADPLPELYQRWGTPAAGDPQQCYAVTETRVLARHRCGLDVALAGCPWHSTGPYCSHRCWRSGIHMVSLEASLYCKDPAPYRAQVEQALREEARKLQRQGAIAKGARLA